MHEAVPVAREPGAADEEVDVDYVGEAVVLVEGAHVVFEFGWGDVDEGVVDSAEEYLVGVRLDLGRGLGLTHIPRRFFSSRSL